MFLWTSSRTVHKKRQEPIKPLRPEIFAKPSSLALFRIRDAGTHEYKFSYQVQ